MAFDTASSPTTSAGSTTGSRDALDRPGDPRRLVALAAIRDRREVRRVGLDQQAVVGHEPHESIVRPIS